MSAQDNERTVAQFNETFNARDWEAAVALCTPDVELVTVPTGRSGYGAEGVRQFLQGWAAAFPDSRVETTKIIADDHSAMLEFTGAGTHGGPLQTPNGDIPPTGRQVAVQFCQILELRDGKIARARLYFDSMSMLGQLGLVPVPGQ
ncbi:MAG: ester cyclase [Chloroflexota bacterium]|nr:ester cyclase [Chloroflexota bacterium]